MIQTDTLKDEPEYGKGFQNMIKFVSGERFQLDDGQTAQLKNTDFTITNGNVMKTIFHSPFDEFYDVSLTLHFKSEKEGVGLSLSSTGAWEEKPTCEWKGFHISLLSADVYHDGTVTLEVTAEGYDKQESVDPVFQETLQAAKQDDPGAMYALSEIYRKGDAGIDQDDSKSVIWCRKAAEAGSAMAMCSLGDRLIEGLGVQKIVHEGYLWYRNASRADPGVILHKAEEGSAVAMYYLGERLVEEGRIKQAVSWFQKAGERGVVRAMNRLGAIFRDGLDPVPQDISQSVFWYERAVDEGDREAIVTLAELYLKGEGIKKDIPRALEWFERATEAGGSLAEEVMKRLGHMYAYGEELPKDIKAAVKWFRKAGDAGSDWARSVSENLEMADKGDAVAMYNLGCRYHQMKSGYELALYWYKRSAEKGHAGAMHKLGVMHYEGQGVGQDAVMALWWFKRAVNLGNKDAMHSLGDMYANERAVRRDLKKAIELFELSAQGASEEALEKAAFYSKVENIIKKWAGFSLATDEKTPESALLKAKYLVDAEKGDADAMYILGEIYRFQKDYPVASIWYHKAADQGHAQAMETIGRDFYNGYGVVKDIEKAVVWLQRAAAQGNKGAMESLERIRKENEKRDSDHG